MGRQRFQVATERVCTTAKGPAKAAVESAAEYFCHTSFTPEVPCSAQVAAFSKRRQLDEGHRPAKIEKSPALVAKLLRVANSVYYGTRKAVSSVREAVIFIGTDYIASLVMAIETFQNLAGSLDDKSLHLVEHIWDQALRRASICKTIAEQCPASKDPNLPYVASLLQDLGLVVRLCSEPDNYARMLDLCTNKGFSQYAPMPGSSLLRMTTLVPPCCSSGTFLKP